MNADPTHTAPMILAASAFDLLIFEYLIGLEMARNRSMDMAARERMEAVHSRMSKVIQASQRTQPKSQVPKGKERKKFDLQPETETAA